MFFQSEERCLGLGWVKDKTTGLLPNGYRVPWNKLLYGLRSLRALTVLIRIGGMPIAYWMPPREAPGKPFTPPSQNFPSTLVSNWAMDPEPYFGMTNGLTSSSQRSIPKNICSHCKTRRDVWKTLHFVQSSISVEPPTWEILGRAKWMKWTPLWWRLEEVLYPQGKMIAG